MFFLSNYHCTADFLPDIFWMFKTFWSEISITKNSRAKFFCNAPVKYDSESCQNDRETQGIDDQQDYCVANGREGFDSAEMPVLKWLGADTADGNGTVEEECNQPQSEYKYRCPCGAHSVLVSLGVQHRHRSVDRH